ncbi:MAG TPA: hypothetical protein PLP61_06205 [Nocardioides sp.]|uniref:hypothetical protein n=1 Tax=Nocardioides sp. TaxID=35761 RepID=UPI002BE742C5|nr:hypothetical protein [Nocardioides sp.]HQR26617.1 hypothetical protein [Nocardioides sp.]
MSPRRWAWPAAVAAVTALYALVPALLHRDFYMRGDTAAQFAPTWYHLGELVRTGQWPPMLDPASWAGGNYAAEALFGIYNPLNVPIWLAVSAAPDLGVVVLAVKVAWLVVLALGTYALARDYGAAPWASAVVATTLPLGGYTLYWDAGSWASGLIAFAYTPWVWWALRRVLHGRLNPWWAFVVGSLAVLQGNPYGTLGVVVVGLGVLVEGLATRRFRGVRTLLLLGVCVAAWLPLVYYPLVASADLAVRSGGELFSNNGKLRPELGDLLLLSSPSFVPNVRAIAGSMMVPAMYAGWFVVPLLPWLRWSVLRSRGRELSGVVTVALVYAVLTLGPSKLWLFRWPVRQVEYLHLALGVGFALLLGAGLCRDHWPRRLALTALLVGATGWLTWGQDPTWAKAALGGPLLLVVLTLALLLAHRGGRRSLLVGVLVLGTGLVLVFQAYVFGENRSSRVWHFPTDVSALQARFADRDGRVLQFANLMHLQNPDRDAELRAAWQHLLGGSMYHVAGVDAVNNYTGMGYLPFQRRLCMRYEGFTRPCGYRQLWDPSGPGEPALVDTMKVDTLVVQRGQAQGALPDSGWAVSREDGVSVLRRTDPLPWPGSELAWASDGVEVAGARTVSPYHQQVEVAGAAQDGRLVFSMLAWPGYRAVLDGQQVPVTSNRAGLLTVELDQGASGTLDVTFRPPGLLAGLAAAALGTLGAAVLGLVEWRRRRRRQPVPPPSVERSPSEEELRVS